MRVDWPGVYIETNVHGDLFEVQVSSYVPALGRDVGTSFSLTRRELREEVGIFYRRIEEARKLMSDTIATRAAELTRGREG